MDKIQLIFFFISGFLVSRLIIKVNLPQRIVFWFIGQRHLSIVKILLYLIAISAFLSFFIPNAITVLTMIPMLELLRQSYEKTAPSPRSVPTMLALSTIYGANIGGMGSITGTPANAILVTYVELNDVIGREYLTFASWLSWGVPLVICFVVIAWIILIAGFRPWRYRQNTIQLPFSVYEAFHPFQRIAIVITAVFFVSSLILSLLMMQYPHEARFWLIVTAGFTLLFVLFLFLMPLRGDIKSAAKKSLLTIRDCYNDLPMRGFLFVGIAIVLAGLLYLVEADTHVSAWVNNMLPTHVSTFLLFLIIALITSFATEVLSNTAVQLSLFVVAIPLAATLSFSALEMLIIITLSCTSAFMSPIATGVNGLAFGGIRGVSFPRMLIVGFFMNTAGAVLISVWTFYLIGWLYNI